jgi:hypothetical protein
MKSKTIFNYQSKASKQQAQDRAESDDFLKLMGTAFGICAVLGIFIAIQARQPSDGSLMRQVEAQNATEASHQACINDRNQTFASCQRSGY